MTSSISSAKVNKTANINVNTSQYKAVCKDDSDYITQRKHQT